MTQVQSDPLLNDIQLATTHDTDYQKIMQAFDDNLQVKNLPLTHAARQLISVWHRTSKDNDLLLVDGQRTLIPMAK